MPKQEGESQNEDLKSLSASSPPAVSHSLKLHVSSPSLHCFYTSSFEPAVEVLALADIEQLQISATLHYRLNTGASDPNTATHAELTKFEEMERNATE